MQEFAQAIKVVSNLVDSHKPIQVLCVYMYMECICVPFCVASKFKVSNGV